MCAVAVDPRRDLDHGIGRQVGQRAIVADVDDLDVAAPVVQRRDEVDRGLAVVRTSALAEQRRLLRERRIAVHLEQPALDVHHVPCPRMAVQLFPHDGVRQVVVAQVVGRDGAHRPNQVHRQPGVFRDPLGVVREQVGEHVAAVHAHGPDPAQVVQADVLETDPLGLNLQPAGQPALHPDRHVAQPERAVAAIDQGLGHDPDRVREVDEPVAGGGPPVHRLGELQDHGHGADCLGQAAGTGRLLADRPVAGRDGLVAQASGLAPDAKLDEHEVGAVERGIAIKSS